MDGTDGGFSAIADLFQNVNVPPIIQTYRNSIVLWHVSSYTLSISAT